MWYEILPCYTIMTVCVGLPPVINYFVHKFFQNGNPYRRNREDPFGRIQYTRDLGLNGNTYILQGLECIPEK